MVTSLASRNKQCVQQRRRRGGSDVTTVVAAASQCFRVNSHVVQQQPLPVWRTVARFILRCSELRAILLPNTEYFLIEKKRVRYLRKCVKY